ncbi:hypothetical protein V8G54_010858 [Vigna mungo]|uniref:Uncharacterized protein n=1 Tax=Vigna mungo TaxID=3915 RepID=A0AAQ3NWM4_VIGMU
MTAGRRQTAKTAEADQTSSDTIASLCDLCPNNTSSFGAKQIPGGVIIADAAAYNLEWSSLANVQLYVYSENTSIPPWKLHLFELEGELKIDPPIKYVLFQVLFYVSSLH